MLSTGAKIKSRRKALGRKRISVVVPEATEDFPIGTMIKFTNLRAKAWAPDKGQPILLWKADGIEFC